MKQVAIVQADAYKIDLLINKIHILLSSLSIEIPKNQSVFLKPNMMSQNRPDQHTVTHPAVIEAMCSLLKDNGCAITIGDTIAFYQKGLTRRAFDTIGITPLAKRYNATLLPLEESPLKKFTEKSTILEHLYIPEAVFESDCFINMCKLKTHASLRLSGGIKNLFGILPGGYKQLIHLWTNNNLELSDIFLDLWDIVKPAFTIMDAIYALDGGPAANGKPEYLGRLLASKNPAALDSTAAKMIGYKPEDITTLVQAQKRGMIQNFNTIKLVAEDTIQENTYPLKIFKNLIKGPFKEKTEKNSILITKTFAHPRIKTHTCSRCGDCVSACPINAIYYKQNGGAHEKYPIIDLDICIRCYHCIHICPEKAIQPDTALLTKIINAGRKITGL